MASAEASGSISARKAVDSVSAMPAEALVSKTIKSRSRTNCSYCRGRRIRCDATARYPSPCSACQRKNRPCDARFVLPTRRDNDKAELTAQVARLHSLLEDLEDEATERENMVDLVSAMTRLCFTDQHQILATSTPGLLQETIRQVQAEPEEPPRLWLEGLVHVAEDTWSRQHLINLLPDEAEASALLEASTAYSLNSMHCMIVFGPVAYAQAMDRLQARAAHLGNLSFSQIAELLAFTAYQSVDRIFSKGTVTRWAAPDLPDPHYARILQRMAAAQRALDLHNSEENPDMPTLRAMLLLAIIRNYSLPTTELMAQGINVARKALSLAYQMDLHREDLERHETPVERYNRRAILAGLVQLLWHNCEWLGWMAPTGDFLFDHPLPEWLSDSSLPPAMRKRQRPDQWEYEVWQKRHRVLGLAYRASVMLSAPTTRLTLKEIGEVEKQAIEIEYSLPPEWKYETAEDGSFKNGMGASTDFKERVLAFFFTYPLRMSASSSSHTELVRRFAETLKLVVNRLFILAPPDTVPDSVLARHRAELVLNARCQLQTWITLHSIGKGCFAGICGGFQSFVTAALACALDAEAPGRQNLRGEISTAIECLEKKQNLDGYLPAAVRRVVLILRFLLHRPAFKNAETAGLATKRVKQAQIQLFAPSKQLLASSSIVDESLPHKGPTSRQSEETEALFTSSSSSPLTLSDDEIPANEAKDWLSSSFDFALSPGSYLWLYGH